MVGAARILVVAVLCSACGLLPRDPDAAQRDELVEQARALTDALTLPPGYERLPYDDRHWQIQGVQTPQESQQLNGEAKVYFRPIGATSTAQAHADFDRWFVDQGYTRTMQSYGGDPQCEGDLVAATWANETHAVALHYTTAPGRESSLSIPLSYRQIPGLGSSNLTPIAEGPTCP